MDTCFLRNQKPHKQMIFFQHWKITGEGRNAKDLASPPPVFLVFRDNFLPFKENYSLSSLVWLLCWRLLREELAQRALAPLFMSAAQLTGETRKSFLTLKWIQFRPVSIGYDRWHYFPETKLLVLSLAIESVLAAVTWHRPEYAPSRIWWNDVGIAIVTSVTICPFFFF